MADTPLTPGQIALLLTGIAPDVDPRALIPQVGALALTGILADVYPRTVNPQVGAMAMAGVAGSLVESRRLYRIGGYATDIRPPDVICLWGLVTTDGNVTHLRQNFTTVGYQVSSGKTLVLIKYRLNSVDITTAIFLSVKFGYADNDVGLDSATARTSAVMAMGIDDTNLNGLGKRRDSASDFSEGDHWSDDQHAFGWPIAAASKYPFVRIKDSVGNNPLTSIVAWCVEL